MSEHEKAKQSDDGSLDTAAPKAPAHGAGVQALQALIAVSHGHPDANAIVKLIDEHRGEHTEMFALLQSTLGNAYVDKQIKPALQKLRLSIKDQEVVQGDPGNPDPNSNYFLGSVAEGGARWHEGPWSGVANGEVGVDTTLQLGEHNALHGKYNTDTSTGTLALEHNKKNVGELYGGTSDFSVPGYSRSDLIDIGIGEEHKIGDGVGRIGLQHEMRTDYQGTTQTGTSANDSLAASFHDQKADAKAYIGRDEKSGGIVGGASGEYKLDPSTSVHGLFDYGSAGTAADIGFQHKFNAVDSVRGELGYAGPKGGKSAALIEGEEIHRGTKLATDVDVTGSIGERNYIDARASADTGLYSNRLFGGVSGRYHAEGGVAPQGDVGASLTFTTTETTALTLAGVIDEHGHLETRLQFDLFKNRVHSVADLSAEKRDALLSIFASYSTSGSEVGLPGSQQNDMFGAPSFGEKADKGRVQVGIKFSF